VAFPVLLAGSPQGHPLVQEASVTDLGCFADDHSHAVVDEHPMADPGPGVDFHTGEQTPQLGEQSRQQRHTQAPEAVAEAVEHKGVEARVAQEDLESSAGGGITLPDDSQVCQHRVQESANR
jgi:hypothetical protein